LIENPSDNNIKSKLGYDLHKKINDRTAFSPDIDSQVFNTIKLHLKALGLVSLNYSKTVKGGKALFWGLTDKGNKLMMELRTIKK
jgi:hypothetical protein